MKFGSSLHTVLVAFLAGSAAAASDGVPSFALVKARAYANSVVFTNTYPAAWDRDASPGVETIPIGGYVKARFRVHDAFGKDFSRTLRLKLTMASAYRQMPEMFLVLDMRDADDITAIWWDEADVGFCLDPEKLHDVGLTQEAKLAASKYPCQPSKR